MRTSRSYLLLIIGLLGLGSLAPRVDAASMDDFGRCLSRAGAVFYGASWCPHCRGQRLTLGDAMAQVRYVECAVPGGGGTAAACRDANVNSYPTWIFGDGSRAHGEQSLARLAAKTACALPAGSGAAEPRPAPPVAAPPRTSGAKIIEVPY